MKNLDFKNFLFKSAVMAMACDGDIADEEVIEIKKIVANEIYFLGYDFEEPLKVNIDNIKVNGRNAINLYLQEIVSNDLNEHQELLIIEILLRVIQADGKVEESESKFLQMVKSKLKVDEQTLIIKFPQQIEVLMDFNNYGLHEEFTNDISI
ncbi:TerB family tellurite resistance protein [Flavobacterium sp. 83]|uniref:TerB family tellurite resistance protein n=1 Tax=Flavobacterium sp. 83 TaxID=1131812 RepID=UPI00054F72AB|nr:TerB family tellurite resistance protein [Flavobacterium sp. 83]